jgi:hypothetical protein
LWEAIDIQEVVNFTRQRLYEHGDIQRVSIELIAKAESRGACDNTSVVIVCFNQQDRSLAPSVPLRKQAILTRSYSLASDTSTSSDKSRRQAGKGWNMIKRHHSDVLHGVGSNSNESLGSLAYVAGIYIFVCYFAIMFMVLCLIGYPTCLYLRE